MSEARICILVVVSWALIPIYAVAHDLWIEKIFDSAFLYFFSPDVCDGPSSNWQACQNFIISWRHAQDIGYFFLLAIFLSFVSAVLLRILVRRDDINPKSDVAQIFLYGSILPIALCLSGGLPLVSSAFYAAAVITPAALMLVVAKRHNKKLQPTADASVE